MNPFRYILPPPRWRPAVIIVTAALFGTASYLVVASKAVSYMSDKPETCINCHIMVPQYTTWKHSSHGRVTNCNDCHVPHTSLFAKYNFKARDGLRHSTLFTLHMEHDVIMIKPEGRAVVQQNCVRCHSHQFEQMPGHHSQDFTGGERVCWSCHREIPHGKVRSLSIAPFARTESNP